jgi:hypothetical protein
LTFPKPLALNLEGAIDALCDRPEFADTTKIDLDPRRAPHESARDIVEVIKAVYAGDPDYPCGTLVLDSATGLLNLIKSALESRPSNVGAWAEFNFECQRAVDAIYGQSPVHVVVIAQEKQEFGKDANGRPVPTGRSIPNADKRFKYAFDVLLRTYEDMRGNKKHRMFVVEKSRLLKLPEGTIIEDFSFEKDIVPALSGGFAEPEIPATLTAEALKSEWVKAGKPLGSMKAWLENEGYSLNPSLDDRIAIDRKLKDLAKALAEARDGELAAAS